MPRFPLHSLASASNVSMSETVLQLSSTANLYYGERKNQDGTLEKLVMKQYRRQKQHELPRMRQLIAQEEMIWSRLNHRNIVPCYGSWPSADPIMPLPILVAPLLANGAIMGYLNSNPHANKWQLLADIAAGLKHLHDNAIVHRNVKPTNIPIDDHGRACLIDFSLSQMMDEPCIVFECDVGTPRYMAHELLNPSLQHHGVSPATDVWSFGMTALEVLTGRPPFYHIMADVTVMGWVAQGRRPDRKRYPPISDAVWTQLARCWHPDPNERPSMEESHTFFNELAATTTIS